MYAWNLFCFLDEWLFILLSLSTLNPGPTKKARSQYTGLQNLPTNISYSDNLTSGLAAMAIGLGKETSNHTAELITPILTCLTGAPTNYNNWQETKIIYNLLLTDADSRVRYYACESLYNVVKVLHNLNCIMYNIGFVDRYKIYCHFCQCLHVSRQCGQGISTSWISSFWMLKIHLVMQACLISLLKVFFSKVSREAVLPLFNEMFAAISCVVADPDQNVKNGSELLDR